MSVISSGKSCTPSILKKTATIKNRLSTSATPSRVRFVLPHSQNVKNILQDYVNSENVKAYNNLVCLIRDSELLDSDILSLLKEATECISILGQDLRLFVEALLKIEWANRNQNLVAEYQSFLVNLLSAHTYHSKLVIDHLVSLFLPAPNEPDWPDGVPTDEDCEKCIKIHSVLSILLEVVPMCREIFLQAIINQFPYFKKSAHIHEYYIHNLFWIMDYQPSCRPQILHLLVSKLIIMDVNAPRDEILKARDNLYEDDIFTMDDTKSVVTSAVDQKDVGHTLDVCMDRLLNYIITECHSPESGELIWDKVKSLYQEMITMFDKLILPTYNTHHIQFCMFVLCSLKPVICEVFLNFLWRKMCDPSVAPVLRQAAVSYIASLSARANYLPMSMLKGTLQQLSSWIHSYIANQDAIECVNTDLRIHSVFYTACQALFYLVAFRHKDLVNTKKNVVFLESLNLAKIVTSRLNPLRVCQPAVVQNFAAVTRKYQLAYCYSVMEHNARNIIPTIYQDEKGSVVVSSNILDGFFPFDPYVLIRSGNKIQPLYREYQEYIEESNVSHEKEGDDMVDDFLEHMDYSSPSRASCSKFSYGTSPGFKF